METPFVNDPFALVWIAYKRLYDKPCEIWYCTHSEDEEGFGYTDFPCDGGTPMVYINAEYPITMQTEILAHELAHVAVGAEHGHDEIWNKAFDAIFDEYEKIAEEKLGKNEKE